MGVCYYIACKDCKVTRDLDKFYSSISDRANENREQMLVYMERLKKNSDLFRVALLQSFLDKHKGHSVVFFDEYDGDDYNPYYRKKNEFTRDYYYWHGLTPEEYEKEFGPCEEQDD